MTLLRQNIDERTTNVVGVAFATVVRDGLEDVFEGTGCGNGINRTGVAGALRVAGRERVAAARSGLADRGGAVGCDSNIHALNLTPLWRMCKQSMRVVM